MKIKTATFVESNSRVGRCPDSNLPEYAFIGRSNVGKSSLINMLTGHKGLALTSQRPGKTLLINHFLINNDWHLVDLPGYGYARRSKDQRHELERIIQGYILSRAQLVNLFVLIDSRHEALQIDLEFIRWLGEQGIPFSIVFTKTDKLSTYKINPAIDTYKQKLLEEWEELPPIFATSAEKGTGRDDLLDYIDLLNKQNKEGHMWTEEYDEACNDIPVQGYHEEEDQWKDSEDRGSTIDNQMEIDTSNI